MTVMINVNDHHLQQLRSTTDNFVFLLHGHFLSDSLAGEAHVTSMDATLTYAAVVWGLEMWACDQRLPGSKFRYGCALTNKEKIMES